MLDKNSILIEPDLYGLFTVIAREYRINHYVYTVMIEGLKLYAEIDLHTILNIGDKCKVSSIQGKDFVILPEKIKSYF